MKSASLSGAVTLALKNLCPSNIRKSEDIEGNSRVSFNVCWNLMFSSAWHCCHYKLPLIFSQDTLCIFLTTWSINEHLCCFSQFLCSISDLIFAFFIFSTSMYLNARKMSLLSDPTDLGLNAQQRNKPIRVTGFIHSGDLRSFVIKKKPSQIAFLQSWFASFCIYPFSHLDQTAMLGHSHLLQSHSYF